MGGQPRRGRSKKAIERGQSMHRREFLRRIGGAGAAVAPIALTGCAALPRSGPRTADIVGETEPLDGLVAALDADAVALTAAPPPAGFPAAFRDAAALDPTRIGVGDLIDVTVWETEGGGIFSAEGGATVIEGAAVEPSGRLYIPFIGPQRAAGATLTELRDRIRAALQPLSLSPQVDVRLNEPRSRLVALQGAVASPGVYPIERATTRLSAMLAAAGGVPVPPEAVEVAIARDGVIGRQILADVFDEPALNIALRPGDLVVLSPIRERFIAMGATGGQAEILFPTRPLDLLSAIAAARGLNDFDADPTGVFVFRWETPAVADALLTGPPPPGAPAGPGRPIVYRLDLSAPQGFFVARSFGMRDGDALFVTNAPLTELRKFLQLFNSVITPVNTVNASAL